MGGQPKVIPILINHGDVWLKSNFKHAQEKVKLVSRAYRYRRGHFAIQEDDRHRRAWILKISESTLKL